MLATINELFIILYKIILKTLVLFDFDGTLYKKDSLLEFTKYYKGNSVFYIGILILSPFLIAMKLGILSNEKAKKNT